MLGMEQLHHAQVHFATAAEMLFKQSMLAELHIRPLWWTPKTGQVP